MKNNLICKKCNHINSFKYSFCTQCGQPLETSLFTAKSNSWVFTLRIEQTFLFAAYFIILFILYLNRYPSIGQMLIQIGTALVLFLFSILSSISINKYLATTIYIGLALIHVIYGALFSIEIIDLLYTFFGVVISLDMLWWIHTKRNMNFYSSKIHTPIKWLTFVNYCTLPISVIVSFVYLFGYIVDDYLTLSDILWIILYALNIITAIVAFIGLKNFKPYGLYAIIIFWIIPILDYGILLVKAAEYFTYNSGHFTYHIEFQAERIQKQLHLISSLASLVINSLYFWRRRYLFLPYVSKSDTEINDYQKTYAEAPAKCIPMTAETPVIHSCDTTDNTKHMQELAQLKELLDIGAITQEEFNLKKSIILAKIQ